MAVTEVEAVRLLLHEISDYLPEVSQRKMFGCHSFFARGSIYALVWPPDRIGLRLSEPTLYAQLLALPGADPWRFEEGGKPVTHWVLAPKSFHEDKDLLEDWVKKAHACALAAPKKPSKTRKFS